MESLQRELEAIKVEIPSVYVEDSVQSQDKEEEAPESYRSNNKKEHLLLSYADNFSRQFRQLYGDRKALLLKPRNEFGVEKFICTTVRPTCLPYKELYEFDGCASFVADYLTYEPLKDPDKLPDTLVSPTLVLTKQRGNCFDYAVLLCSLLTGVGYDAYCVCGYALQDITLLNQTRKPCPLLQEKEESTEETREKRGQKYPVRPPTDLSSQFEVRQEAKRRAQAEEEEKKKREEEEARIAELEKPPQDKYYGLRFHCWVVVLSGKREVAQSFFLEATTGETHPLDWEGYLGIEALWNHRNYWVNMQDCSQGIKLLEYDLGDATKWEFFFPGVEKPLLVVPGDEGEVGMEGEEEEEEDLRDDFELPPSWVLPIQISPRELETRCPRGKKTVLYRKAKLEKFAEYLNQDGLVLKLALYQDTARTAKVQVRHYFRHREDHLQSREENSLSGQVQERFDPGRPRALKEHVHYGSNTLKAANRTMLFYSDARVDGLAKREMTVTEMVEHFENRPDFLHYRHTTFEKVGKKFESAESAKRRRILKIVEKFHHNPAVPPNSDIAERTFLLRENRIQVVYHLEKDRITPSTREFTTPPLIGEQAHHLVFSPDMTSAYQVDPYATEPKQRHLFELLEGLVRAQEESISQIRAAEREVQEILDVRLKEELSTSLSISVYDVARDEASRKHRQEMEQHQAEEERIRKEKERDYLAPFLAHIGDPPTLSRKQMEEVTEDCLRDLRSRLVEMANIIQARFEHETEELQRKQAWYKASQGGLTKEDEAEYISYCNDAMFRIHILEQRLNRHKTTAPQKYMELDRRLKSDPRLTELYG